MQSQLEQLEEDFDIEWREYKISEFFDVSRGNISNQKDLVIDPDGISFIAQNDNNNGFVDTVNPESYKKFKGNSLVIGRQTGVVYYQDKDFVTTDGVLVLTDKNNIIRNKDIGLAFAAAISKQMKINSFGYSNTVSAKKLDNILILLPARKSGDVNIDFMEEFINILKSERVATLTEKRNATLDAYLASTNLADYEITDEEQAVLDGASAMAWAEFKISDVFEKLNLKKHKKPFNKLNDTSTTPTDEFNLPLVNAKLGSNGIMFYGREAEFDSAEMTIDVVSNGAVATGSVYAQPQKTGVLWDAYLLKPKNQKMTKHKLLYLAASLQKSIRMKFSWEDKAVWSKVQHETIMLPVKSDGSPDYDCMSLVIAAVQKQVINEVASKADRVIDATSNIVQSK